MRRVLAAALLIVTGFSVPPVAAQGDQTGTLRGVVVDTQSLAVLDVIVTITSPALQGERVTRTDGDGNYVFRQLPPGPYTVKFEKPGFGIEERSVLVPLGGALELNLALDPATVTADVQVVGYSPAAESSPIVGLNIRQAEVEALPLARTLFGIATLSPGLNENSPNAGQLVISGSFAFDNMFMVNGVDVNDNVFGDPQNLFINDAIAETQVLTSGLSAEYGRFSGGVVNAITKSGGNTFDGSYRLSLSNPAWMARSPFEIENDIEHEDQLNSNHEFTFGGPLSRDRVWFFAAGRRSRLKTPQTFDFTGQDFTTDTSNHREEVNVTGTVAPAQTLKFGFTNNHTQAENAQLLPFAIERSTLVTETDPNWYLFGNYRGAFTNVLAELQFSERRFRFEGAGGTDTNLLRSPILTITQDQAQYNAPYFDANDIEERNNRQFTANLTSVMNGAGRHEVKVGYEFYRSQLTGGGAQSATDYVFYSDYLTDENGLPVLDEEGRLIPVFVPFVSEYDHWRPVRGAILNIDTQSVFAQNHWAINRRLSADIGIRYEHATSMASDGTPGVDAGRIVPRLAVAFAPRGDDRLVLKSTYGQYSGRYNEAQLTANANVGQPNLILGIYAGPEGQGRDFAPGFDPENYIPYYGRFPAANVSFDDLKTPLTEEFTISAGGAVGSNGRVEATYVWRNTSGIVEDFIEARNGQASVVQDGLGFGPFTNSVYRNTDIAKREYQGLIFDAALNPNSNFLVRGLWTIQLKNDGNYEGEATNQPGLVSVIGDFPEAISEMRHYPMGRIQSYQRHRVRLWGIYDAGLGRLGQLQLAGMLRVDSGRNYSLVATVSGFSEQQTELIADYPESLDTFFPFFYSQDLFFGPRGAESFKGQAAVDFGLTYRIPILGSVEPWIDFEVFNLFNTTKQIAWNTFIEADFDGPLDSLGLPTSYIQGSDFGRPTSAGHYQAPREFQVSLGVRF